MTRSNSRLLFAPASLLALFFVSGCDSSTAGLSGKVTVDGEPVNDGYIAFYPEGKEGKEASTKIEKGEYKIKNVTLGKNKVRVTIAEKVEPATPRTGPLSRESANAERLGKKRIQPIPASSPNDIIDNDQIKEIESGTSQLDIALKTRGKS